MPRKFEKWGSWGIVFLKLVFTVCMEDYVDILSTLRPTCTGLSIAGQRLA